MYATRRVTVNLPDLKPISKQFSVGTTHRFLSKSQAFKLPPRWGSHFPTKINSSFLHASLRESKYRIHFTHHSDAICNKTPAGTARNSKAKNHFRIALLCYFNSRKGIGFVIHQHSLCEFRLSLPAYLEFCSFIIGLETRILSTFCEAWWIDGLPGVVRKVRAKANNDEQTSSDHGR